MESDGASGSLAKDEGASSSRAEAPDSRVDLLIRTTTPGTSKDLTLKLELVTTVGGLKEIIQAEHKDSPAPKDQVLILAGKVLKDADATLGEELLKQHHTDGPYSIHLVVKETTPAPGSAGVAKLKPSERSWSSNAGGSGGGVGSSGSGSSTSWQRDGAGSSSRSPLFRRVHRSRPASETSPAVPTPHSQLQASNVAVMPQGAVAVPYMMVNPVVSAAYSAAFAAMSNATGQAPMPAMSVPSLPSVSPPSTTASGNLSQASTSGGAVGQSEQRQQQQQQGVGQAVGPPQQALPPLIPAIAFFPLGVPMLVPAATPPQGFQVHPQFMQPTLQPGQAFTHPQAPPPQFPHQPHMANNIFQAPVGPPARHHHHHHHGPGQPPRRRRRRVVMYRISIRGLLQLILMLTVLYAYTSRGRFLALVGLFCVLYLAARPLRRILSHITRGGVGGGARPGHGQPRGFIQEILTLVLGFVTSVFPAWNVNVQDEAAFAAAQDLVNREERERVRNPNGENRNLNGNANAQEGNARPHQD